MYYIRCSASKASDVCILCGVMILLSYCLMQIIVITYIQIYATFISEESCRECVQKVFNYLNWFI